MSGSGPSGSGPGDEVPRLDTDRYAFKRKIGRGGQGDVWLVHDAYLQLDVALKLLPRGDRSDEDERRFREEAQRAIRISAANVIRLYDYNPDVPYLVMEYCDGGDLTRRIMSRRPTPVRQTLQTARQICEGLAALHEQPRPIVHRDLKPGNVLVHGGVPKIVDFGLSKELAGVSSLTRTRGMMGTVSYASPEQLQDASKVDARTDLWALGVILQEMLTWERPFDQPGDDLVQVVLRIRTEPPRPSPFPLPDAVARLIGRALQKDPAARYTSAREMGAAVAAAMAAVPGDLVLPPPDRVDASALAAREAAELLDRGDTQGASAVVRRLRALEPDGSLGQYWEQQVRAITRGSRARASATTTASSDEDSRIGSIRSLIRAGQHREARRRLGQLLLDEAGNTAAERLLSELSQDEARLRAELDGAHREADRARSGGDPRGLVAIWERMAARVPEHPEVKAELAVARKELALQARVAAREVCAREASAAARAGDEAEALRRWESFLASYPDDPEAPAHARVLRELLESRRRRQAALDAARDQAIKALLRAESVVDVEERGLLDPLKASLAAALLRAAGGAEVALPAALRSATQALDAAVSASLRRVGERAAAALSEAKAEVSGLETDHRDWRSLDELEARLARVHLLDPDLEQGRNRDRLSALRRSVSGGAPAGEDLRSLASSVEGAEREATARLEETRRACERAIAQVGASATALKAAAAEAVARSDTAALRELVKRAGAEEGAAAFRALAARAREVWSDAAEIPESRSLLAMTRTGTPIEVAAALEALERSVRERAVRREAERKERQTAEQRAREEVERKVREEVARKEAELRARQEEEERARQAAEQKVREEAKERARLEAERRAREEADQRAKRELERKKREEADRQAKEEADRKAREERSLREAEERRVRAEAERKAREDAERAREAARKAREEAKHRAGLEVERIAREKAEQRARAEAERKARKEARQQRPAPLRRAAPWVAAAGIAVAGFLAWKGMRPSPIPSPPAVSSPALAQGKTDPGSSTAPMTMGPAETPTAGTQTGDTSSPGPADQGAKSVPSPTEIQKPVPPKKVDPPQDRGGTSGDPVTTIVPPVLPPNDAGPATPPVAEKATPPPAPTVDWARLQKEAASAMDMPLGSVAEADQAVAQLDKVLADIRSSGEVPAEQRGVRVDLLQSLRRAHDFRDIHQACQTWKRGYQQRDADLVRRAQPSVPPELSDSFTQYSAILVDLDVRSVDTRDNGRSASVVCAGRVIFQPKAGKKLERGFSGIDLYRDRDRWIIRTIRWDG